jgi:hypothetical protein
LRFNARMSSLPLAPRSRGLGRAALTAALALAAALVCTLAEAGPVRDADFRRHDTSRAAAAKSAPSAANALAAAASGARPADTPARATAVPAPGTAVSGLRALAWSPRPVGR